MLMKLLANMTVSTGRINLVSLVMQSLPDNWHMMKYFCKENTAVSLLQSGFWITSINATSDRKTLISGVIFSQKSIQTRHELPIGFYSSYVHIHDLISWGVVMVMVGRWSIEEPQNNPLQNDLGLVLKVIVAVCHVSSNRKPCQKLYLPKLHFRTVHYRMADLMNTAWISSQIVVTEYLSAAEI